MLWLGAHSGNYGHQLGFSSDGRIYDRYISGGSFVETINGGSWKKIAWTSDIPVTLKNPNAIKFKNISGSEISYDGSAAIDLTSGIHYANIAANISGGAAGSIPYQTAAGTTAFLAKGTSGQVLKMNSSGIPYWTTDNNSNSWRAIQVNGTQIAGTGTGTYAANFISGTGITVTGTAGSSSAANNITITNAGVRSTTINGDYLRVNTNGTNADLTIPFATKAKYLTTSLNTITTTTDDTVAKWSTLGNSVHMYSATGQLNNQPSQFGFILNLAYQNSDVHQIWATQSSGNLYHRGGNHSGGWANSSAWRTILDSANSSISGDGGSTWGSSITVKINNVSKTLTIPSNPNTDEKVKQAATTASTYRPIILGYTSSSSAAFTDNLTNQVYYSSYLYVNPSSGSLFVTGTGGINLKASTDSGNPPQIKFLRGTETDTYTDWAVAGFSDGFQIRYKYSTNSWTNVFKATTTDTYIYKPLSITGGLSLTGALTSTVATGTAPLSITSTTKVTNLNADMLDGYHASDFFLNTDLLEGFSIEDLTVEATVRVSRYYYYNTSGVGSSTVYNTSGNGLTNPVSNSLLKPGQIGLKAPIIKVISVAKTGNASTYTANIGEQYITVNFSGTSVANTGDSFEFTLLLPAFNNS